MMRWYTWNLIFATPAGVEGMTVSVESPSLDLARINVASSYRMPLAALELIEPEVTNKSPLELQEYDES